MEHAASFAYTSPFFVSDIEEFQEEIQQFDDLEIKNEFDEIRITATSGKWNQPQEVVETIQRHLVAPEGYVKVSQVDVAPEGHCVIKTIGVAADYVTVIDSPDYDPEELEGDEITEFFSDEPYTEELINLNDDEEDDSDEASYSFDEDDED